MRLMQHEISVNYERPKTISNCADSGFGVIAMPNALVNVDGEKAAVLKHKN